MLINTGAPADITSSGGIQLFCYRKTLTNWLRTDTTSLSAPFDLNSPTWKQCYIHMILCPTLKTLFRTEPALYGDGVSL